MSRKTQRLVAIAIVLTVILVFSLYPSNESITWKPLSPIPQSSPPPILSKSPLQSNAPALATSSVLSQTDLEHSQVPDISKTIPGGKAPDVHKISDPEPLAPSTASSSSTTVACKKYEQLQKAKQQPWSTGWRQFPYSRPSPECRTFNLPAMEKLIDKMKTVIKDPDLSRLFENSYPNTLDTMIKWRGYATTKDPETGDETTTDEELTYVITGDIDAMWLRDSASQIYSYLPLLEASSDPDSLASLWRGLINIHARYIIISPYCHSFQPPPESGVQPTHNGAFHNNHPVPPYDPSKVFDCKWELDSLASFLQISVAYYERTKGMGKTGIHHMCFTEYKQTLHSSKSTTGLQL